MNHELTTSIHTGGGAHISGHYCDVGAHSFVAVRADYANVHAKCGALQIDAGGSATLYLSPGNARQLAEQILAALPDEAEQKVRIA